MGVAAFQALHLVFNRSDDTLQKVSVRLGARSFPMSHFRNNVQLGVTRGSVMVASRAGYGNKGTLTHPLS